MRIAFFADNFYPEISGISDSILITGQELARRGHQVCYVAPWYAPRDYEIVGCKDFAPARGTAPGKETASGLPVVRLPSLTMPNSPTKQSRIAFPSGASVHYLKEEFKPDIIHTNSPWGTGLEALKAARRLKVPLVGTNHTMIEEFVRYAPGGTMLEGPARRWDAWYYNHCRFVSAPYEGLLKGMRQMGFKRPSEAIPNPAELPLFRAPSVAEKTEVKREMGLTGPVVLYAGRLAPEKHADKIVRAVALLAREVPDLTFIMTGHGAESQHLKALAEKLGIAERVRMTGFIPMEKLAAYYRAADIFAIMSTADSQSVSLMQGYAAGLPAVGARSRGLIDYLPEDCGFLVEPGDVEALAARLKELAEDPLLRERMGKAGINFVKQFSPAAVADRWERIYAEAMAGRAA